MKLPDPYKKIYMKYISSNMVEAGFKGTEKILQQFIKKVTSTLMMLYHFILFYKKEK